MTSRCMRFHFFGSGTRANSHVGSASRSTDAQPSRIRYGWVSGSLNTDPTPTTVTYDLFSGGLTTYLRFAAQALGLNRYGWLTGMDTQGRAVLTAGSRVVVLPDLARHDVKESSNFPVTVSDDGRTVAGQAADAAGTIHAVVWRCE
jgi:hypothetical protein